MADCSQAVGMTVVEVASGKHHVLINARNSAHDFSVMLIPCSHISCPGCWYLCCDVIISICVVL